MGFHDYRGTYITIATAIKNLDIDKFQALTNNVLIDFTQCIEGCGEKSPRSLLDYLSVMLKAKNRDPYLQSLFVSRLWEMFSTPKAQVPLTKSVALNLLPLLFLRERNPDNLKKQLKLYFKLLDEEPHDVFLSKIPTLVNLFQNPFFNDADEVIKYLKNRKNGFDIIGFFKVKEQCYYQKEMLLGLLKYIENNNPQVSIEALYKACNNISFNAVCHCRGGIEICWISYSPKEIQLSLDGLLLKKLGLEEKYREFIPMIVASKQFRDLTFKGDTLVNNYMEFIIRNVEEFYNKQICQADNYFKILKRLNIPSELYVVLQNKHSIEKQMDLCVVDESEQEMIESSFKL